jgi:hypothetical protein
MLNLELILPYVAAVLLVELTPGPNMGFLAIVSAQWGRPAGLATVAGITLGLLTYMLGTVVGLSALILQVPGLYQALRWAGIAYLLWLAWDTWKGGPGKDAEAGTSERPGSWDLFLRGLVANLLNPKVAVFYITLLPGFTDTRLGHVVVQSLILGSIHIAFSVAVHLAIVFMAARAGPLLETHLAQGRGNRINLAFALGLVAIAAWMAWETRT